jgi:hypothetical protein
VLTGSHVIDPAGAGAAGAAIVGGGVTVLAGFVGFVLGAILLVLGRACGRGAMRGIAQRILAISESASRISFWTDA